MAWRAGYELRKRTGLLKRRFPISDWTPAPYAIRVANGSLVSGDGPFMARFFFVPGKPPDRARLESIVGAAGIARTLAVADDYAAGRFLYYSHYTFDLGRPSNWLLNPLNGGRHESATHWCDYPTFSPTLGDIKDVWEPSRFAGAFWLARAYALTGNEKYPEAFWTLVESWLEQNPPNRGPNFKCGQETALRCMAWCFGLAAFLHSPSSSSLRLTTLLAALQLQAERIAANIDFAISQKNNHALSEAVGVFTIGLLFPDMGDAPKWEALGRRVLEQEVARQVYDDGSYVQQSMNYHRVMLHDCLWAIRLAELNGRPLSDALRRRVAKAGEFLFEMLDEPTGRVPNYGPNDGALVLPLSSCDYLDYRPTVQAACYFATGNRALADGPGNEMLLWLYGPDALDIPKSKIQNLKSSRFDSGGYYTLRAAESWCMVRCHAYRDRPTHVDMLHMDLWYKGTNVLGDSGTYKYFAPENPKFEKYFKNLAAHNSVEIDGRGPLDLVSRFMWLPWPKARCIEHATDRWVGEHYAYARAPWNVTHRREICRFGDGRWEIRDHLAGTSRRLVKLRWHVADGPYRASAEARTVEFDLACGPVTMEFEAPAAMTLTVERGLDTPGRVSGWTSEYYGRRTPRPTVELAGTVELPATMVTRIRLGV